MPPQEQIGVRCGGRFTTYEDLFGRALRARAGPARARHRRRRSGRAAAAQLDRVPRGLDRDRAAGRERGADQLALARRGDRPRARRQRREGARRARRPVAGDRVERARRPCPRPRAGRRATARAELPDGALWWPDWLAENEPWAQPPETAPFSIIYTSGTTGRPKGVVRTPGTDEQREATRALLGELFQLAPGERTVIPAPMYHSAPNVYALAAAIRGMDMTIMTQLRRRGVPADRRRASRHGRADGADDVRAPARPARARCAPAMTSPRCAGSCTPPRRARPRSSAR